MGKNAMLKSIYSLVNPQVKVLEEKMAFNENLRIFYNIAGKYWVELSHSEPNKIISFYKMDVSQLEFYNDKVVKGKIINSFSSINCGAEEKYHVIMSNKIFCVKEISFWHNIKINKKILNSTNNICASFRLYHKEALLNKVFVDNNCTIEQALQEINKYTFCDHYSLWLYNDITKYFTLFSASFDTEHTFKELKDDSIYDYKYQEFIYQGNNDTLKNIKSLNRIKIKLTSLNDTDNSYFLIVSFFSKHDNYVLRKETIQLIREILNLKFSKEHFPKVVASNKIITDLSEKFQIGRFGNYLRECVLAITEELGWEAASIFIKDNNNGLKLKALQHSGDYDRVNEIIYSKGDNSMTSGIFENNKINFSYDINVEPRNTHKFDEKTKNDARNWIGIPIAAPNIAPVGVLRVKNKLNREKQVVHFDQLDINILKDLAKNIAYQYTMEQEFIEGEEENQQLTEFVKTYRHEIKTPLTLITTTSTRLVNRICDEYKITKHELPRTITQLLEDFTTVASRLVYVANSLSFDANDLVRNKTKLFPFRDIVIPIISFSVMYAEREHKNLIIDKDSCLRLSSVYGDANSSQMAFHAVIDNAIKYSSKNGIISVYGKEDSAWCKIIVESDSKVTIPPEDKDMIFTKYYRTKEVIGKKIEGSGIGLFLAKDIMSINGGRILLTNLNNPTVFELYFPKY